MLSHKKANFLLGSIALLLAFACFRAQVALGQRGGNNNDGSGDDDDFDDAGFDDSGYNQPAQRDTDSSNHSPSSSGNYSPSEVEDLDDDDEVDESHVSPQVAPDEADEATAPAQQLQQQRMANAYRKQPEGQHQQQVPFLDNVQTQNFFSSPQPMLVANLHPAGLAPIADYPAPEAAHLRYRRSTGGSNSKPEGDIEDESEPDDEHRRRLIRRKRHAAKGHSYIGPVYTYVKTDKHANFKWGVKHKVGKHHG